MNYQEGFLIDRITVRVRVVGFGEESRAGMVAGALDFFLNDRGRVRVFRKENDRYTVILDPEDREDLDVIVGVIDPLPSSLKEEAAGILEMRGQSTPVIWLLNRQNPAVDMPRLTRFLGFHPDHVQEEVPFEVLCRAEYGMYQICEMTELKGLRETADHIKREYGSQYIR